MKTLKIKSLLVTGVVAIVTITSVFFTLADQSSTLKARGKFNPEKWEDYLPYAWEIGLVCSATASLAVWLGLTFIPDDKEIRDRQLRQALKEASGKNLTPEEFDLIAKLISYEKE